MLVIYLTQEITPNLRFKMTFGNLRFLSVRNPGRLSWVPVSRLIRRLQSYLKAQLGQDPHPSSLVWWLAGFRFSQAVG